MKKKKSVDVPTFGSLSDVKVIESMGPKGVMEYIDNNLNTGLRYLRAMGPKRCDMRGLFIRYGQYSRKLNTALRKIMEDPKSHYHWKLAYAYWWNRTHYLETYRDSFLGGASDRKKIDEGKATLRTAVSKMRDEDEARKTIGAFMKMVDKLGLKRELDEDEINKVFDGEEVTRNYE
jgi:hypothetical protein